MNLRLVAVCDDQRIEREFADFIDRTKLSIDRVRQSDVQRWPSTESRLVLWAIRVNPPVELDTIRSFLRRHPLCRVICLISGESSEFETIEFPEGLSGVVRIPTDLPLVQRWIEIAVGEIKLEQRIRQTRVRIEQLDQEFEVFLKVGRAIASTLELKQVLTAIMNITGRLLESEAWSLALVDAGSKDLVFESAQGEHGQKVRGMRVPIGKGIIGWVAEHGEPLIVDDASKDERHYKEVDAHVGFHSRSILCLPLKTKGHVLGAIEFINKKGKAGFNTEDINKVQVFIDLASVSIENALYYRKVALLCERDELSGLYNQRTLVKILGQELEHAASTGGTLAYLFLDLDYFKRVNDKYGHLIGRQTLHELGQILTELAVDPAIIGRYGGDEFWVIIPGASRRTAMDLAERIRAAIEEHVFLESSGLRIRLTASVGVALYPEQALTFDDLARMADRALFAAKQQNRNKVICAVPEE